MHMSDLRQKLSSPGPLIGLFSCYPSPGIIERIGPDWDFVLIDGQHGQHAYGDILNCVRACEVVGVPGLIRVPWLEAGVIGLALDTDAAGVVVPCIDSVEEARAAVAAAKFPPLGRRSYGARRVIDRRGRTYSDTANTDKLLIVQIESPQAIEAADAIAAIEGVDALMLGPDDVMLRRGFSMTTPRSTATLGADMKVVADACRRHGKLAMGVGFGAELFNLHLSQGYRLVICGSDVPFLANSSKAASSEARTWVAGAAAETKSSEAKPAKDPSLGPY
jgi:4-hydroxy-2-oxoheptanedioate aldolase